MRSSENLRNTLPEKAVPLSKRSKKAQRAHHALRRADWNGVTPVTRVVPDQTKYNRKKLANRKQSEF
jgi:citrate lyase beta subunit